MFSRVFLAVLAFLGISMNVWATSNTKSISEEEKIATVVSEKQDQGLPKNVNFWYLLEDVPSTPIFSDNSIYDRSTVIEPGQADYKEILCEIFRVTNIDCLKYDLGKFLSFYVVEKLEKRFVSLSEHQKNSICEYFLPIDLHKALQLVQKINQTGRFDASDLNLLCEGIPYGVLRGIYQDYSNNDPNMLKKILQAMPSKALVSLIDDYVYLNIFNASFISQQGPRFCILFQKVKEYIEEALKELEIPTDLSNLLTEFLL